MTEEVEVVDVVTSAEVVDSVELVRTTSSATGGGDDSVVVVVVGASVVVVEVDAHGIVCVIAFVQVPVDVTVT